MNKARYIIKIAITLFISYLISVILMQNVFISNGPAIRSDLGQYIVFKINNSIRNNFIASLFQNKQTPSALSEADKNKIDDNFKKLEQVAFTAIAPGVAVRASERVSETRYSLSEVKWLKHKAVVNGKEVEYGWPEGRPLPSQEMLERLFKD